MISEKIARLESDLAQVNRIVAADEEAVQSSGMERPVERVFLASSRKLQSDLGKQLQEAKAERAHELLRLRLHGTQLSMGTIQLRKLGKIIAPLNALLEQSAWRIWDKEGHAERLDEKFIRQLDLRLAGVESGSTELVILGNTSPDLTGESALEVALRNLFSVLSAPNDTFAESAHEIGTHACKSLTELMGFLEKENIAAEFSWPAADAFHSWDGRPTEITRMRTLLETVSDPEVTRENLKGVVQVLSIRGKLEIYLKDSKSKIPLTYHKSLADEVNKLHLGETIEAEVEKTVYPKTHSKKARTVYRLISLEY